MPIFLLVVAVIFLVSAVKGSQCELIDLLKSDFSGQNNFILWVLAIVVIVGLGSIKAVKPLSDAFLGLVILVMIVANYKNGHDIVSSFVQQVKNGTS